MIAIVEYKTSKTAYTITSVIDMNRVTVKDIEDTTKYCNSRGGYYIIKSFKKL